MVWCTDPRRVAVLRGEITRQRRIGRWRFRDTHPGNRRPREDERQNDKRCNEYVCHVYVVLRIKNMEGNIICIVNTFHLVPHIPPLHSIVCMRDSSLSCSQCLSKSSSKEYNVLMKWTLSKCVLAGIATDADKLPALFDDAHTPRLPWRTKLFWAMCVRAVAFVTDTGRMALTETHAECKTLKSNMSRFSTPETYEITTIHVHER